MKFAPDQRLVEFHRSAEQIDDAGTGDDGVKELAHGRPDYIAAQSLARTYHVPPCRCT